MTVKQFKNMVSDIPTEFDNKIVVLQKDLEGNGFWECRGIDWNDVYFSPEDNEVTGPELVEEDEWEDIINESDLQPCIILYP